MSYCQVEGCRYVHTHISAGHQCGICKQFGHGQEEHKHHHKMIDLISKIETSNITLPQHMHCTVLGCKRPSTHTNVSHICIYCGNRETCLPTCTKKTYMHSQNNHEERRPSPPPQAIYQADQYQLPPTINYFPPPPNPTMNVPPPSIAINQNPYQPVPIGGIPYYGHVPTNSNIADELVVPTPTPLGSQPQTPNFSSSGSANASGNDNNNDNNNDDNNNDIFPLLVQQQVEKSYAIICPDCKCMNTMKESDLKPIPTSDFCTFCVEGNAMMKLPQCGHTKICIKCIPKKDQFNTNCN